MRVVAALLLVAALVFGVAADPAGARVRCAGYAHAPIEISAGDYRRGFRLYNDCDEPIRFFWIVRDSSGAITHRQSTTLDPGARDERLAWPGLEIVDWCAIGNRVCANAALGRS